MYENYSFGFEVDGQDLLSRDFCSSVKTPLGKQVDLPVALPGLSGGPKASGDPGENGLFCVVGTQGFEPGKPLPVRCPSGDILSPFDFVSFPLQPDKQMLFTPSRHIRARPLVV